MKKLSALFLSLLLLAGCSNAASQEKLKIETYKTMYTDILNASAFKTSSDYFSVSASINDMGNGTYRYDVIVDEAKVAMYDVEILLIQDDGSLVISDKMMPSVGIFEGLTYYMIPYQANAEANYVKGFGLNGISSLVPIRLKMVVRWKDAQTKAFEEYFQFTLTPAVPA